MLTKEKYIMNFLDNGNLYNRNSDCISGGDELKFQIKHPDSDQESTYITGVELHLLPYVPGQGFSEADQYLEKINIHKDFDELEDLDISITVFPEYSYLISGSFKTKYGILTPSENFTSQGEFERMMNKVGCNIKNEFYFSEEEKKPETKPERIEKHDSSILCATACHLSDICTNGWSYQISTGTCNFYNEIDITLLQPSTQLDESDLTIGWASGLKSCTKPGTVNELQPITYRIHPSKFSSTVLAANIAS